MKNTVNKKRLSITILALLVLAIHLVNIRVVSAPPESPYITVDPSSSLMFVGYNRTISIKTDYAGGDVWGWGVKLTFDKTLMQCVKVANGDLITAAKDPTAEFHSNIDNTIGKVEASAFFYYDDIIFPPFVTSGPGTLVKITFKGLSTGYSNLHLEDETKLQVFNATKALERGLNPDEPFSEIEAGLHYKQIGHGNAMISIAGDAFPDQTVDTFDKDVVYADWGKPGYVRNADINYDGSIDTFDKDIVYANWGQSW